MTPASSPVRFGSFELNLQSGELRKDGLKIRLADQPLQVLTLLLEHPGELVTREELQRRLWSSDTFVEFEHSLNAAVKRLREALGDSAEYPRFVETLPRHGYRFIAPLKSIDKSTVQAAAGDQSERAPTRKARRWAVAVALLVVAIVSYPVGRWIWQQRHHSDKPIRVIAVLPLENLSNDPSQEYFADGMTEELIITLGKISSLRVISRQSVMRYKGTNKPLPEIARELHVDGVVEGSVLRSGDRVRISAQLIQAEPEKNLWAESYERDLRDILALQGAIANDITHQVQSKVTPEERGRLVQTRVVNSAALDAYLMGQYEFQRRNIPKATQYFEQAVTIDPEYALAYSALANAYVNSTFMTATPPASAFSKAEAAANKSLQLDEGLSGAHADLAWVKAMCHWDWAGAESEFQRALALNPNSAPVRRAHAWYLAWVGNFREAILEGQKGLELDPNSASSHRIMGAVYFAHRQYDEALQEWNHSLELSPNDPLVTTDVGRVYVQKGLYADAITQFEKARALTQGDTYATATGGGLLGNAYALTGRTRDARNILSNWIARSKQTYVSPLNIAMIYTGLGDKEKALEWLQKGYDLRDGDMVLLKVWPVWDPLRSDQRFQELLHGMNFPP